MQIPEFLHQEKHKSRCSCIPYYSSRSYDYWRAAYILPITRVAYTHPWSPLVPVLADRPTDYPSSRDSHQLRPLNPNTQSKKGHCFSWISHDIRNEEHDAAWLTPTDVMWYLRTRLSWVGIIRPGFRSSRTIWVIFQWWQFVLWISDSFHHVFPPSQNRCPALF